MKQEEGDSLRRQQDIAVKYCNEHNLQLVDDERYSFLDRARSAYHGKNLTDDKAELKRFFDLVEDGSIPVGSYLIVESLDRLSRQHPRKALPRFLDLLDAGINIVSVNDNKVYRAGEVEPLDLIVSIMEMSRSHSESANKSVRVGQAWRNKQELARSESKPLGATRPAWLDPVYRDEDSNNPKKKPTHYVINEVKANVVRQIFQWTLDGYGRGVIAKKLNEAGVPAFRTKNGWGGSSVAQILKSPTVIGVYQPYRGKGKDRVPVGEPIKGLYAPIVSEETYYSAQDATDSRFRTRTTKHPAHYNVWQKVLKCALCHASMNYYTKGANQPPSLRCYEAGKGKCKAKAIRVDRSENAFKELLTKVNSLALVQSDARSMETQLSEVQGRIAERQRSIAENKEFLLTRPSQSIRAMIADADDEIAALKERQLELEKALATDAITNKEDFFARLDLTSYEGRSRANQLLKRLGILVTANKVDDRIGYVVYRNELRILSITDPGAERPLELRPYSGDTTIAMYRQGEIDELYYSPGFNRRLKKPGSEPARPSPVPGPNWGAYEEPSYEHDYVDEHTPSED